MFYNSSLTVVKQALAVVSLVSIFSLSSSLLLMLLFILVWLQVFMDGGN
jgi:hypothetical protein